MSTQVESGRNIKVFLANQADFTAPASGNAGEGYPVTGNAVRVITASANGDLPFEDREDQFGTASPIKGAAQKGTAEANLEAYYSTSGSRTGAPPMDQLLQGSGWKQINGSGAASTISGTSSTKTVINVQTGHGGNFVVGSSILIETGTSTESFEIRRIKAINTDAITIHPPLSFTANTAGLNVKGGFAYAPDDNRDSSQKSLCMWVGNTTSMDRVGGWTPGDLTISLGGDAPAKITASGTARQHLRQVSTQIGNSGGINNSQTTIEIGNGYAFGAYDMAGEGTYFLAESEIMKVVSVDTSSNPMTVEVVRNQFSSGAATHAQGITLLPLGLSVPFGGPNPSPSNGFFSSVAQQPDPNAPDVMPLQVTSMTITAASPLSYIEDEYGDMQKVAGYVSGKRDVQISLSGWTNDMTMQMAQSYSSPDSPNGKPLLVQNGEEEGNVFGFFAPAMNPSQISLDRGSEIITAEIAGKCYGSTAGADDLFFLFG